MLLCALQQAVPQPNINSLMALPRLLSSSEHQGQVTLSTPYFTICALKVQVTKETTHLHLPTWEAQGEPSVASYFCCMFKSVSPPHLYNAT